VLGKVPCYQRLAHYLRLAPTEIDKLVPKVIEANRGHEDSYLGRKWPQALKEHVEKFMVHDRYVKADFAFWGYQPNAYKLSLECESLPWMARMRAKKGPLPGDATMLQQGQ
jgi:hypothetical protein